MNKNEENSWNVRKNKSDSSIRNSSKSENQMEGSTSERGKKINEYRSARQSVPKVKMGASDVLGVVHERLEKVATKSEEMADRVDRASSRFVRASQDLPNEIASKMDAALQKEVQFMQQSTKKTLDEFKAWCNKWMLWFFGAVGCAVLFLIMSIFMSVKASQANDRCDRLREERDSIQYRENVFKKFAAEHPEDFNRWLDKQNDTKDKREINSIVFPLVLPELAPRRNSLEW